MLRSVLMLEEIARKVTGSVRLLLPLGLAVQGVFLFIWLILLAQNGPTGSDWSHLKRVADHFVAGDWTNLYTIGEGALHPSLYWRYPPFALYLVAPLAWLSPTQVYLTLAVLEVVAIAASLAVLGRLLQIRRDRDLWVLSVLGSAPALTTIVTGQSSGLMLLCLVAAAWFSSAGRPVLGGALLGALGIKPNWGAVFGFMAIVRRDWRTVAASAGVVLVLCIAALPLGADLWWAFFESARSNDVILATYDNHKLITLRAFLQIVIPSAQLAGVAWMASALALTAATVAIWRRPAPVVHHVAAGLLLAVVVNPYASFYDALLLVLPATVWWTQKARWHPAAWRTVGCLIWTAWAWEHVIWTWGFVLQTWWGIGQPSFSLVGPTAAAWLGIWTLQRKRAETPPAGSA